MQKVFAPVTPVLWIAQLGHASRLWKMVMYSSAHQLPQVLCCPHPMVVSTLAQCSSWVASRLVVRCSPRSWCPLLHEQEPLSEVTRHAVY